MQLLQAKKYCKWFSYKTIVEPNLDFPILWYLDPLRIYIILLLFRPYVENVLWSSPHWRLESFLYHLPRRPPARIPWLDCVKCAQRIGSWSRNLEHGSTRYSYPFSLHFSVCSSLGNCLCTHLHRWMMNEQYDHIVLSLFHGVNIKRRESKQLTLVFAKCFHCDDDVQLYENQRFNGKVVLAVLRPTIFLCWSTCWSSSYVLCIYLFIQL